MLSLKLPHWAMLAVLCAGACVAALMKQPESPQVMQALLVASTILGLLSPPAGQP